MSEVEHFDVLVVGLGPAGSLAAREAALGGARVLAVDAARVLGGKPHCAEYVPRALALEINFPERSIAWKIEAMETMAAGRTARTGSPGFILDRWRFDRGLAETAASAGAEIRAGVRLTGRSGDAWRLTGPDGEQWVRPGALVAADGAASRVGRLCGLPAPPRLTGVQVQAPLARPLAHTTVFFDPAWRFGYAWLFPKGPTANLGLGMKETSPGEAWRALAELAGRLRNEKVIRPGDLARTVGAIPVGGPPGRLTSDNVFFAGDAAGLTHPITGAGIPQAVWSGMLAGRAAADLVLRNDRTAPDRYALEILSRYGKTLAHALEKRRRMEENWHHEEFYGLVRTSWPAFREYRS